jgi:hypothetical protein
VLDGARVFGTTEAGEAGHYDPSSRFTRTEVGNDIDAVEAAITAFAATPTKHRRAFAAWVTIKARP